MPNFNVLIPYLSILLPFVMPFLGDALASVLAQDQFNQEINDLLAWLFLILAAVATVFAANQLTGNANQVIGVVLGAVQLLLSGPLTKLQPWVSLTALVQSKVFNVVPAVPTVALAVPLAPLAPMAVQPPVAQPAQLTIMQPEVPFSVAMQQQSQASQFKAPVPPVAPEHPPIDPKDMVNTLPTLPAFKPSQSGQPQQ